MHTYPGGEGGFLDPSPKLLAEIPKVSRSPQTEMRTVVFELMFHWPSQWRAGRWSPAPWGHDGSMCAGTGRQPSTWHYLKSLALSTSFHSSSLRFHSSL